MSDSVWLALISLLGVMITAVAPVLGALAAVGAVWISWRNGRKMDATKEQVTAAQGEIAVIKKVAERTSVEAKRSKEEIDFIKTGAFALGVREGQKRESNFQRIHGKSSDLGTLE